MPLNAALEIAAFPFLLILAIYLKRKYTTSSVAARRFNVLVDVTLLVIIADVLSRQMIVTENVQGIPVRAALAVYYILATLSPYYAMRYAIAVIGGEYPRLHRVHLVMLWLYAIFHIANIFLEFIRVQGTPDMPVQGLSYALATFGLPAYFMGLGAILMLRAEGCAEMRLPVEPQAGQRLAVARQGNAAQRGIVMMRIVHAGRLLCSPIIARRPPSGGKGKKKLVSKHPEYERDLSRRAVARPREAWYSIIAAETAGRYPRRQHKPG